MILEPSIDNLQKEIKSKYVLVTLSARRAKDMQEHDNCQVSRPKSVTYVGKALEEIQMGKLNPKED